MDREKERGPRREEELTDQKEPCASATVAQTFIPQFLYVATRLHLARSIQASNLFSASRLIMSGVAAITSCAAVSSVTLLTILATVIDSRINFGPVLRPADV